MREDPLNHESVSLECAIGPLLRLQGLTLAVAESCTGGLICHRITSVPGSSDYFDRGVVVYSNRAKTDLLGVDPGIFERYGAVSAQCAEAMARGVLATAGIHLGLSVTGIAGPTGGSPTKPVGTVFIALASRQGVASHGFLFPGDRAEVKARSSETALEWVWRYLNRDPFFHCL